MKVTHRIFIPAQLAPANSFSFYAVGFVKSIRTSLDLTTLKKAPLHHTSVLSESQ